jgi:hypothetical protein
MSIISASKIFTDQNEELTFIVERVRTADKEKVALIIPENALVFSSPVSIKILQRMMYKAEKSPIIVTEDSYGQKFTQKIGLVTVSKTSQITEELWDIAFKRKVKYNNQMRDPEAAEAEAQAQAKANEEEEKATQAASIVIPEVALETSDLKSIPELEKIEEKKEELGTKLPTVKATDEELGSILRPKAAPLETVELEAEVDENKEDTSFYRKQRETPKVVTVGGISVFSGGDAKLLKSQFKNVKIRDNTNQDMERTFEPTGSGRFTGKDFTKKISPQSKIGNLFTNMFNRNKRKDLNPDAPKSTRKKKIILAIIAIAVLTAAYLLIFQFSSVDIRINATKQDVSATSQVFLDPTVTEIGTVDNKYVVPAKMLTVEKFSASWTGEATGVGRSGNKAGGTITIYNNTSAAVTVAAGTKIVNKSTGKSYAIKEAVSLAARAEGDVVVPTKKENVAIEAVDFGPEYNIDSAVTQNYSVEGHDDDNVFARSFSKITGGTVEEFVTVSQENLDNLKKLKETEFKTQAETKLKGQIPGGSFLIIETIELANEVVSTAPKMTEKSLDGTFALTIEVDIVGYVVSNDDFKTLGEKLISESQDSSVVNTLDTPQITSVKKESEESDVYVLDITTSGSVGQKIVPEEIEQEIAGGTLQSAREYIDEISGVESFSVKFAPGFIPQFLQFVPSSLDRISIKVN